MSETRNEGQSKGEIKRYIEKGETKVLVYEAEEKCDTTRSFIQALKNNLREFEFKGFKEANEQERNILSIIVVVRHTSIRLQDGLNEVKNRLNTDNVKDFGRVILAYFTVNETEETGIKDIKETLEAGQICFEEKVLINFIDESLVYKTLSDISFGWINFTRYVNRPPLQKLKTFLQSRHIKKEWFVNVYVCSPRAEKFISELRQYISSAINLDLKPLEEPIKVASPTLICKTGDVDCSQDKLEEIDLKRVFLIHIIDVEKRCDRRIMHDSTDNENASDFCEKANPSSKLHVGAVNNTTQNPENMPCEICEVLYYNGKFKIDFDFINQFETFVCTWLDEIKSSSE